MFIDVDIQARHAFRKEEPHLDFQPSRSRGRDQHFAWDQHHSTPCALGDSKFLLLIPVQVDFNDFYDYNPN